MVADQQRASPHAARDALTFRNPSLEDGVRIHDLIAACPPLEQNSLYCNLLLCAHFSETCFLAERDGEIVGWISGYRPPLDPTTLFIWQIAVRPSERGAGLGRSLIRRLMASKGASGVARINTTITADNSASWALFRAVAAELATHFSHREWLRKEREFAEGHETEFLVTIGPYANERRSAAYEMEEAQS